MNRRLLIAGLGVVLAILLAVVLRPSGSNDGTRAAEPAANVGPGESAGPPDSEDELEGE